MKYSFYLFNNDLAKIINQNSCYFKHVKNDKQEHENAFL
jgi:hypothetical protein